MSAYEACKEWYKNYGSKQVAAVKISKTDEELNQVNVSDDFTYYDKDGNRLRVQLYAWFSYASNSPDYFYSVWYNGQWVAEGRFNKFNSIQSVYAFVRTLK